MSTIVGGMSKKVKKKKQILYLCSGIYLSTSVQE